MNRRVSTNAGVNVYVKSIFHKNPSYIIYIYSRNPSYSRLILCRFIHNKPISPYFHTSITVKSANIPELTSFSLLVANYAMKKKKIFNYLARATRTRVRKKNPIAFTIMPLFTILKYIRIYSSLYTERLLGRGRALYITHAAVINVENTMRNYEAIS